MQERRRFAETLPLSLELLAARGACDHLVLHLRRRHALHDHLDELLPPGFESSQLTFGGHQRGAVLAAEPVHLAGELFAEFLEQILTQELLLKCAQNPRLDLVTPDGQVVRTRAFVARAEASKAVLTRHDEACAAHAAFREPREEILRAPHVADVAALHDHVARRFLTSLGDTPQIVTNDPERRQLLRDPLCFRIEPGHSLAGIGVLHIPQPIPYEPADVQLVVQDAGPAFRIPVDGARAPGPAERPGNPFPIQLLRDRFRCHAGHKLAEDPLDDRGFRRLDFALARRQTSAAERLDHAISVTEPTSRLAVLDTSPQSAVSLLGQILQEQRVHRAFEADVQVRDIAFREGDDVDAGEGETLEQTGRVFLVAAEAVERFGEDDIEVAIQRIAHQRLETGTKQRGSRHRMVGVLLRDRPTLSLGKRPADAHLIGDGCVALVVRRVAGVDGYPHAGLPQ